MSAFLKIPMQFLILLDRRSGFRFLSIRHAADDF
jgi:hypothetical protein